MGASPSPSVSKQNLIKHEKRAGERNLKSWIHKRPDNVRVFSCLETWKIQAQNWLCQGKPGKLGKVSFSQNTKGNENV